MKNLKFSRQAVLDIEEIYLYGFINFGEGQADSYASRMQKNLEIISSNPDIGRLDSRINPAIHRFDFARHAIFYDVTDSEIIIIRILHITMDFLQHLSQN
ncbi:toxin ParE1/3/4 [Kordia periserrulae]|uniref:Toxin n=1 Tax=Kordia periserrulae TaxID=701523 RepID=A0A2T6BR73_9FLAO|nr:type II toxin-antitoxin system RelE/ParE family toxin [Kordia periserrulae]PTX58568.1 toxin ParE1/3/4 [Kordia periserrulae]